MAGRKAVAKPKEISRQGFDLLRLDNQLCFALYAATRAVTKTYRERLAPIGLTYPQYLTLLVLWEYDGITISEIGKRLILDSGTITPLVKRLEAMDFLRRERGTDDEREVRVWLNPKAYELRDAAVDARKFVACRLGMTEEEILCLRSDLMGIVDQLGKDCAGDSSAEPIAFPAPEARAKKAR